MSRYPTEYPDFPLQTKTVVKQKTPQGYLVVNTVKGRNWLICFLFAVIVGLGVYIAYLHLRDQCAEKRDPCAEKRDPCADCKIDTPVGQMSCSFLGTVIKTMKQNPGNSGMGQSGLQGLPDQSGLQGQSGQLIATNPSSGTYGYYNGYTQSPLQAAPAAQAAQLTQLTQTNPEQAARMKQLHFQTA